MMKKELGVNFSKSTFEVIEEKVPKSFPQVDKAYTVLKEKVVSQYQTLDELNSKVEEKNITKIKKKMKQKKTEVKESEGEIDKVKKALEACQHDATDFQNTGIEDEEVESFHNELLQSTEGKGEKEGLLSTLLENTTHAAKHVAIKEFTSQVQTVLGQVNHGEEQKKLDTVSEDFHDHLEKVRELVYEYQDAKANYICKKRQILNQPEVVEQVGRIGKLLGLFKRKRQDREKSEPSPQELEIQHAQEDLDKKINDIIHYTADSVVILENVQEYLCRFEDSIKVIEQLERLLEYYEKQAEHTSQKIGLKQLGSASVLNDNEHFEKFWEYSAQIMQEHQKELDLSRNLFQNVMNPEKFDDLIAHAKTLKHNKDQIEELDSTIKRFEKYESKIKEFEDNYQQNKRFRKQMRKLRKEEEKKHNENYDIKFDYREVNILVRKGNLVEDNSEAIVNPANCELDHAGGAARAIADAAGEDFHRECKEYIDQHEELPTGSSMITAAGGKLECHKVIHTVGPIYNTKSANNIKQENQLRDAFESVLEIVKDEDLQSVAIPAISTGIFNFPIIKCCQIMAKTLKTFIDSNPQSMLGKQIVFCNLDEPTTKVFRTNLENYFYNEDKELEDNSQDNDDDEDSDSEEEAKTSKKASKRKTKYSDSDDSEEDAKPKKSKMRGKTKTKKAKKMVAESILSDEY